ncbi:hypothetical protein [Paenibacillus sp. 32352]|uniref:hypothetical protein n=1 Tax=Paenibacillus sp. 32352 TaxID=1969111 RepID=UPI0009AC7B00|nr:hypothetical protein [Paenibacillus sp. 32352]
MTTQLRIALPKDNLETVVSLLEKARIPIPPHILNTRAYLLSSQAMEWIIVKQIDIPMLVERGSADLGITAKHILWEQPKELVELLDLGTDRVELFLFGESGMLSRPDLTIATKYPRITSRYFQGKGKHVRTIPAILDSLNASDAVVAADQDYALSPGRTIVDTIAASTDRLIANRSSYCLKQRTIDDFCSCLQRAI